MFLKRLLLVASALSACYAFETFEPKSLSYDDLFIDAYFHSERVSTLFRSELQNNGLISITGIPGFGEVHKKTVEAASRCGKVSAASKTSVFADGTKRTTLAGTYSTAEGLSSFNHGDEHVECAEFDSNSFILREMVSQVSLMFSKRLSGEFVSQSGSPFLSSRDSKQFDSILSVVEAGKHLDHFHSYKRDASAADTESATIDFHTDQGLFIAFVPATTLSNKGDTGLFLVQLPDGSQKEVVFGGAKDSIVFMMGDGVNQFINPKLAARDQMYSPPHAFKMRATSESERLWYGRMFLAPEDAIMEPHGMTYAEIRQVTVESKERGATASNPGMGCSGGRVSRELSDESCGEDTIFCWNRCMNATAFGLFYDGFPYSETTCQEKGYQFMKCIDPASDTIYNATVQRHGGFRPGCTNSTEQYVASPLLTQPDNEECSFDDFLASGSEKFTDGQWQPSDDFVVQWKFNNRFSTNEDELCFRVAYNGWASWLSLGFYNVLGQELQISEDGTVGSRVNFMVDTPVVMGVFNDEEGQMEGVYEYLTHPSETRFYLWNQPLNETSIHDEMYSVSECFSEMQFCTSAFGDRKIDMTNANQMMWGYDSRRLLVSKHTPTTRGTARIDFTFSDGVTPPSSSGSGGMDDELKSALVGGAVGAGSVLLIAAAVFFNFAPSKAATVEVEETKETKVAV